jgi:hypothetical protein
MNPPAPISPMALDEGVAFPWNDWGSRVEGRESRVEGRGSRVEGRGSRVEGRGSRVEGRGSRVEGRGSRVEGVALPLTFSIKTHGVSKAFIFRRNSKD